MATVYVPGHRARGHRGARPQGRAGGLAEPGGRRRRGGGAGKGARRSMSSRRAASLRSARVPAVTDLRRTGPRSPGLAAVVCMWLTQWVRLPILFSRKTAPQHDPLRRIGPAASSRHRLLTRAHPPCSQPASLHPPLTHRRLSSTIGPRAVATGSAPSESRRQPKHSLHGPCHAAAAPPSTRRPARTNWRPGAEQPIRATAHARRRRHRRLAGAGAASRPTGRAAAPRAHVRGSRRRPTAPAPRPSAAQRMTARHSRRAAGAAAPPHRPRRPRPRAQRPAEAGRSAAVRQGGDQPSRAGQRRRQGGQRQGPAARRRA